MNLGEKLVALESLHEEINSCRVCSRVVQDFTKPVKMNRGSLGTIVVVGQGPGKTEILKCEAFSGNSGKRLNEWLMKCGTSKKAPRAGIYLTSLIKCSGAKNSFQKMARNCRSFLHRQLSVIRPELVITLGQEAFEELRFDDTAYDAALCREYRSKDYVLVTPVGFHYTLLPWPHPSGLNRWHNYSTNVALLQSSFNIVRTFLPKQ